MKRSALIVVIALAAGWSTVAFAAGLPLIPGSLGSGSAAVLPCDTDGFTISYTTSQGNVTSATVGGIKEPECAGGALVLTLVDSSGAAIASGGPVTVPSAADPGSVAVSLSPQPGAGSVAGFRVTIAGP